MNKNYKNKTILKCIGLYTMICITCFMPVYGKKIIRISAVSEESPIPPREMKIMQFTLPEIEEHQTVLLDMRLRQHSAKISGLAGAFILVNNTSISSEQIQNRPPKLVLIDGRSFDVLNARNIILVYSSPGFDTSPEDTRYAPLDKNIDVYRYVYKIQAVTHAGINTVHLSNTGGSELIIGSLDIIITNKDARDLYIENERKSFVHSRYAVVTNVLRHEMRTLSSDDARDPFAGINWKKNIRMTTIEYDGTISETELHEKILGLKRMGFNTLLNHLAWYLFADTAAEKIEFGKIGQTFENTIRFNKTISAICKKYGLKFILHQTCTMANKSRLTKRPDFAAIDIRTGSRISTGYANWEAACINSESFQKEFLNRLEIVLKESGADGLMQDEVCVWRAHGICGCRYCREKFNRYSGFDLPAQGDNAAVSKALNDRKWYHAFTKWQVHEINIFNEKINKLIHTHCGKDGVRINYLCNVTGAAPYPSGIHAEEYAAQCDIFGYEIEPHDHLYKLYWPHVMREFKYIEALGRKKGNAPWALFYSSKPAENLWCWLISFSQGSPQWWRVDTSAAGNLTWGASSLRWEEMHQDLCAKSVQYAEVGVLHSFSTKAFGPALQGTRNINTRFSGICDALNSLNIPYKVILDDDLAKDNLYGITMLFTAGALNVSEAQADRLRKFVKTGGTLIASGGFSLYDQDGNIREDFLLADLLGVSYNAEDNRRFPDAYFELLWQSKKTLPFFERTLAFDNWQFFSVIPGRADTLAVLEKKLNGEIIRIPALFLKNIGKGTVIYSSAFFEDGYFFHYYNMNLIKPGEFWKDERLLAFRTFIKNIVTFKNASVLTFDNMPEGVVAEPRILAHQTGPVLQIRMINFSSGLVREGYIKKTDIENFLYPEIHSIRPDKSRPITAAVKLSADTAASEKLLMFSPDFSGVLDIPFTKNGTTASFAVPDFRTFALFTFVKTSQDAALTGTPGRLIQKVPAVQGLITEIIEPVIGQYNPANTVLFADDKAVTGGNYYAPVEARIIYGSKTPMSVIEAEIKLLDKIPANAMIEIGGMDDNRTTKCPVLFELNGKVLFSGMSEYPDNQLGKMEFSLPAGILQPRNKLVIKNTSDSAALKFPPWFGFVYVKINPGK